MDGPRIILDAGDIVIFPHGDAHILRKRPCDEGCGHATGIGANFFPRFEAFEPRWRRGKLLNSSVGFMACEPRLSQIFLNGLPPVFTVSIRNDASGRWLENSIAFQ
jgi:hypothetical protein